MGKCFSFTASRDRCYRRSFSTAGLKSTTSDIGDGTVVHFWGPKHPHPERPSVVLLHGLGANAMWQWGAFVRPLAARFDVYVPDLLFFGGSYTARPERGEAFQARCVMRALELAGVGRVSAAGISYGGFVAYSMAAQFPGKVERVVVGCAGVCLEEGDMEKGMFGVRSVEEAVEILLPQTPENLRELIRRSFYRPAKNVPSCFLSDFIDVMCTENLQQKKELIYALQKDRKLSDLPKITQPTLIIWGEHDQIFPLELAHRLVRHLEGNAQLVVLKKAGHAINIEKPKELYRCLKSFLDVPANPKLESNDDELDKPKLKSNVNEPAKPNPESNKDDQPAKPKLESNVDEPAKPNPESNKDDQPAKPKLESNVDEPAKPMLESNKDDHPAEPKLESNEDGSAEPKLKSNGDASAEPKLESNGDASAEPKLESNEDASAKPKLESKDNGGKID